MSDKHFGETAQFNINSSLIPLHTTRTKTDIEKNSRTLSTFSPAPATITASGTSTWAVPAGAKEVIIVNTNADAYLSVYFQTSADTTDAGITAGAYMEIVKDIMEMPFGETAPSVISVYASAEAQVFVYFK